MSLFSYYSQLQLKLRFTSSDGRVVRASTSGTANSGLIPSRVKPMALKFIFSASPLDAQHQRNVRRTTRQAYVLCHWKRHLAGLPHLSVVDRRPATPKPAVPNLFRSVSQRRVSL